MTVKAMGLVILVTAAAAIACGGPHVGANGGGGPTPTAQTSPSGAQSPTPVSSPDGGMLEFILVPGGGGAAGFADLLASESPNLDRNLSDFPLDVCYTPVPSPSPVTASSLAVGSALTLSSSGTTPVVFRHYVNSETGLLEYSGGTNTGDVETVDTAYDVMLSGTAGVAAQTWSGALRVPKSPAPVVPAFDANVGLGIGDFTFTWTPNGSDAVEIDFYPATQGDGVHVWCLVRDDGSFTVPAAMTSKTGSNGSIIVFDIDGRQRVLQGRNVELFGVTYAQTTFSH